MNQELLQALSKITEEEEQLLAGQTLKKEQYTAGKSFVISSEKMLSQGKLIDIRTHTRFIDFPAHTHNYIEMIYMYQGNTEHNIGHSLPITLVSGEILFLNQHVSHSIKRATRGDIAINVMALPPFFDTAFQMIGPDNVLGNFLVDSLQSHGGQIGYLHFKVSGALPVQNLMENLIWSLVNPRVGDGDIQRVTMGLLFLELLQHTQHLELPAVPRTNHALVLGALREIEENYPAASLTSLARRGHVSVPYLSQLIRQSTGTTFKRLLQEKRLARTMHLLETTTLSVREIMTAVGYQNSSYFYRLFREQYGDLPSAFRTKK